MSVAESVEIECYEKQAGMLRRTAEMEVKTYDAPLGDILKKIVPLVRCPSVCTCVCVCVCVGEVLRPLCTSLCRFSYNARICTSCDACVR